MYLAGGPGELAMRLPALVASIAAVLLMFPLARMLVGGPGWPWAVGLVALCYHGVTHGCEVKPYAGDLLATEAILLAGVACLSTQVSAGQRRWGLIGLCAAAVVGPWLSFPSVFILGGASAALFLQAWSRGRLLWFGWLVYNALVLLSVMVLWRFAAQQQDSATLQIHWARHFFDLSSPQAAVLWLGDCLVSIGNYGTTGMGIPLLLLALPGLCVFWSRSPSLVVLLICPLLLALAACAMQRYPLGDRLVFFAVPCFWLPAAAGLGFVVQRMRGRFAWLGISIPVLLLLPGAVRMSKALIVAEPKCDYRGAFAYVSGRRMADDVLWVCHPEVYQVYYGKQAPVLSTLTPVPSVAEAARRGRLWMVVPPASLGQSVFLPHLAAVYDSGAVAVQRSSFIGVDVVLFDRPAHPTNRSDLPAPHAASRWMIQRHTYPKR
jgi:hypothetical protein